MTGVSPDSSICFCALLIGLSDMPHQASFLAALACASLLTAASCTREEKANSREILRSRILQRYLSQQTLPDSKTLIPPPPARGSAAAERDLAIRQSALKLRGTQRYALAIADVDRNQVSTVRAFECAFGDKGTLDNSRALNVLLAKTRFDVRTAAYRPKLQYKRVRPWVAFNSKVCSPEEATFRTDGSYPSAAGAVGWAYALILAELKPDRREALLARGREYEESRVICDAEWQSDIDAGQVIATEVVRRLNRTNAFRSDLEAARNDVAAAARTQKLSRSQCTLEERALAQRWRTQESRPAGLH